MGDNKKILIQNRKREKKIIENIDIKEYLKENFEKFYEKEKIKNEGIEL